MADLAMLVGNREIRPGSAGRRGSMTPCLAQAWFRLASGSCRLALAPDRPGRAPLAQRPPVRVPGPPPLARGVPVRVSGPSALARGVPILARELLILAQGPPVPAWRPPCGVRPWPGCRLRVPRDRPRARGGLAD